MDLNPFNAIPCYIMIVYGFCLPTLGTTLTTPDRGGFIVVSIPIIPLILLISAASITCQSTFVHSILLLTCMLVDASVWFSFTMSIDCKSKNDKGISLVEIVVQITRIFELTNQGRFAPSCLHPPSR